MKKRYILFILTLMMLFALSTEKAEASQYGTRSPVVIYEVYSGTLNNQVVYKNDYVVLNNVSDKPIDLSAWKVGYYTKSGGGPYGLTTLNGILQPGKYYLIEGNSNTVGGIDLPREADINIIFNIPSNGYAVEIRTATSAEDLVGNNSNIKFSTATANGGDGSHSIRRIRNTGDNSKDFIPIDLTVPGALDYLIRESDRIYTVEFKLVDGLTATNELTYDIQSGNKLEKLPEINSDENYVHRGWTADVEFGSIAVGELISEEVILNTEIRGNIIFTAVAEYQEPVVVDTTPPTINGLIELKEYVVGDEINLLQGVTAVDEIDGEITFTVNPETIDNKKPGTYTVTYTAIDKSNNKTEITVTVIVKEIEDEEVITDPIKPPIAPITPMPETNNINIGDLSSIIFNFDTTRSPIIKIDLVSWNNPFIDVKSTDWFYNAVEYVNQKGIMLGTTERTFNPDSGLQRGMLVEILHRMAGSPAVESTSSFIDVSEDDYYSRAVAWAKDKEIIKGISRTEFGAELELTKEQLITIMYRYATYTNKDISFNTNITVDGISEWAEDAFKWAISNELLKGVDFTSNPKASATRAEIAEIIMRYSLPK